MDRRARWATLATIVAVGLFVVLVRLGQHEVPYLDRPSPLPLSRLRAYDFLFQVGRLVDMFTFYQNMVYGVRGLVDGGRGLWWNPYQNCGQPFFGRITAVQLYPPYVLAFLAGGPHLALWLITFIHLVIAGLFTYLLCRELGAGRTAALCGAVAFELGNATMETAVWQPYANGSYVWLPAAMLFCERTLRRPTAPNVIGLALALALALLAGFPQAVFFTYLLIGLRVAWALASRPTRPRAAVVLTVGLGLLLAPLVAGLQLIPAAEVARLSVRSGALTEVDRGFLDWRDFRLALGLRASVFQPLVLVPCMLGAAALLAPATRRRALFYACAGLVFFLLALGPSTPLIGWYLTLPLAAAFRWPHRMMWVTGFCLAVVAALGAEALLPDGGARARSWSWARAVTMTLVVGGFHLLAPDGLRPLEWVLGGLVVVVGLGSGGAATARGVAAAVILVAVVLNLVAVPVDAWQSLFTSGESVFAFAPTFSRLRARMTAQDRVYFNFDIALSSNFGLSEKSASVFEVPGFFDYEPQISSRYAEFLKRLRGGVLDRDVGALPQRLQLNRSLLDLAAGRFLMVEPRVDNADVLTPPPALVEDGDVRLYENPQALPRARYVPHIEVVDDSPILLGRLASGADDPRQAALVEAPLPSGFTGVEGNTAPGTAEFLRNDPEHVVLRVVAPARGFLVLADQYFPGWQATVDGEPRPIVRANYVFRLVEVPAGASRVEFSYAPGSVRLGAWVSGLTLLGMIAGLAAPWVRRRSGASPPP